MVRGVASRRAGCFVRLPLELRDPHALAALAMITAAVPGTVVRARRRRQHLRCCCTSSTCRTGGLRRPVQTDYEHPAEGDLRPEPAAVHRHRRDAGAVCAGHGHRPAAPGARPQCAGPCAGAGLPLRGRLLMMLVLAIRANGEMYFEGAMLDGVVRLRRVGGAGQVRCAARPLNERRRMVCLRTGAGARSRPQIAGAAVMPPLAEIVVAVLLLCSAAVVLIAAFGLQSASSDFFLRMPRRAGADAGRLDRHAGLHSCSPRRRVVAARLGSSSALSITTPVTTSCACAVPVVAGSRRRPPPAAMTARTLAEVHGPGPPPAQWIGRSEALP